MEIIDWTHDDFSPTYRIEVDSNVDFVRLVTTFNIPPEWDKSKEMQVTPVMEHYAEEGWQKSWQRAAYRKIRNLEV